MIDSIFSLLVTVLNYIFDWFVYTYNSVGIDIIGFLLVCFATIMVLRVLNNGVPHLLSNHKLEEPSSGSKSSGSKSSGSKSSEAKSSSSKKEGD